MAYDLLPGQYFRFPAFRSVWDDEDYTSTSSGSGLSISEDDKNIYVEAAVPGIDPKDIEVTYDKGMLWIKGESKNEEKQGKKFYRRATSAFSYRVVVPGEIDQNKEPTAVSKNGIMQVSFSKVPQSQPKKITVRETK